MPSISPNTSRALCVFLCGLAAALSFALYTDHVWEDYYITYRSSKNLATGHGLVFNHGDKLHTFTSPLGVLLPAVSSLLSGNSSDTAALWIFRVMCAAALGGAAMLLLSFARRNNFAGVTSIVLLGGLLSDSKTLDFTINGMETAFMLLFLAYALRAHLAPGPRQWLHLGAAWAGLMWTRPDSFIYVGLIAAGFWLFNEPTATGSSRWPQFKLFVRAGLVTTALYLPWLLWAWTYYGTPIPHTVTAKGGIGDEHTLAGLLGTAVQLPWLAWTKTSSLELTFLPSYYMIGGWPQALIYLSRTLATLCCLLWLLPGLRSWARAASFAYFGAHLYLSYFPYFPFPWYIPSTTLLALVAFAGLVQWLVSGARSPGGRTIAAAVLVGALLIPNLWCVWQSARQIRSQQLLVEDGNRRKIGEWLKAHAQPVDTVFMEPLGYIGFFSGLKTYDWPGMSSREMVEARQEVGASWGAILRYLQPNWVVLRPFEVVRVNREAPGLLSNYYESMRDFDQTPAVRRLTVYGRPYLEHDAHFTVFRRRALPLEDPADLGLDMAGTRAKPTHSAVSSSAFHRGYNGHAVSVVHAPANFEFQIGPDQAALSGGFGLLDESWIGARKSGPVTFTVTLRRTDGSEAVLWQRTLDTATRPDDRGVRSFQVNLPSPSDGTLRFSTQVESPSQTRSYAFWSELGMTTLHTGVKFEDSIIRASAESRALFGLSNLDDSGPPGVFAHAPATLIYPWQTGMNRLSGGFGLLPGAYEDGKKTDGVVFVVEVEDAQGRRDTLYRRHLEPAHEAKDRGEQMFSVAIPPIPGGRILLHTQTPPSGHLNYAWSYWRNLHVTR